MSETGTVSALYTQRARGKNHAKGTSEGREALWAFWSYHGFHTNSVFRGFRSSEGDEA